MEQSRGSQCHLTPCDPVFCEMLVEGSHSGPVWKEDTKQARSRGLVLRVGSVEYLPL